MRQKCGRRKTCRIFAAYFQLIVVYCIYKQKKAEGDLPVNILIVADEPRLADVVYTGTDGLDYAQNGSGTGLGLANLPGTPRRYPGGIRAGWHDIPGRNQERAR